MSEEWGARYDLAWMFYRHKELTVKMKGLTYDLSNKYVLYIYQPIDPTLCLRTFRVDNWQSIDSQQC